MRFRVRTLIVLAGVLALFALALPAHAATFDHDGFKKQRFNKPGSATKFIEVAIDGTIRYTNDPPTANSDIAVRANARATRGTGAVRVQLTRLNLGVPGQPALGPVETAGLVNSGNLGNPSTIRLSTDFNGPADSAGELLRCHYFAAVYVDVRWDDGTLSNNGNPFRLQSDVINHDRSGTSGPSGCTP